MYRQGHSIFREWLDKHPTIEVDFFYHAWYKPSSTNEPEYYVAAPWRNIPKEHLRIEHDIIEKLNELYCPKMHCYDEPMTFDCEQYIDTIAYRNAPEKIKQNRNNVLSQFYSRNCVRNLLETYMKATNIKYDFVVSSRFDFLNPISIDLHALEMNKLYTSAISRPRKYIPDMFNICSVEDYLHFENTYSTLDNIVNNADIEQKIKENGEQLIFNVEQLLFANYLYWFRTTDRVHYSSSIPNFYS